MIPERKILQEIVKFAKKEYREKKPSNVKILRIKDETIFRKGEPFKIYSFYPKKYLKFSEDS